MTKFLTDIFRCREAGERVAVRPPVDVKTMRSTDFVPADMGVVVRYVATVGLSYTVSSHTLRQSRHDELAALEDTARREIARYVYGEIQERLRDTLPALAALRTFGTPEIDTVVTAVSDALAMCEGHHE